MRQHVARRAIGDAAAEVQHGDVVGDLLDQVHVVIDDEDRQAVPLQAAEQRAELARELGLEGPVELALRFALAKAGVSTVIVGYSDHGQLRHAIRWAERGPLDPAAVGRVVGLVDFPA